MYRFVKAIFILSFFPVLAFADTVTESFKVGFADIYKAKSGDESEYELVLTGRFLSERGEEAVQSVITIPVEIEGDQFGIDLSFQWAGVGGTDTSTGGLRHLDDKTVSDIFGVYHGKAGNLGLGLLGGGVHRAKNQRSGIVHTGGAAALLVGPAGAGGLNLGITLKDYYFILRPAASKAQVRFIHVDSKWEFNDTFQTFELNDFLSLKLK